MIFMVCNNCVQVGYEMANYDDIGVQIYVLYVDKSEA